MQFSINFCLFTDRIGPTTISGKISTDCIDEKKNIYIICLILLHLYVIYIGFVPLSSTARETNVDPKLTVEWTPYNLHGRIVNGTKAALRQFPYQVRSCKIECFLLRYTNCNYTVRGISGLSSWKWFAGIFERNSQLGTFLRRIPDSWTHRAHGGALHVRRVSDLKFLHNANSE